MLIYGKGTCWNQSEDHIGYLLKCSKFLEMIMECSPWILPEHIPKTYSINPITDMLFSLSNRFVPYVTVHKYIKKSRKMFYF